jgi:hypothetical protein
LLQERPSYLPFDWVKENGMQPGSVLEGSFSKTKAEKPHIEDRIADIRRCLPQVSSDDFLEILEQSAVSTIEEGFGALPNNRVFPRGAPPPCSIITLEVSSPKNQLRIVEDRNDKTKIKAFVTDVSGYEMAWVPITDLGFHDHAVRLKEEDPGLRKLNSFLQRQEILYLRIGLSRAYRPGEGRDGYWIQLNGIYSFPEYRTDLRVYE